MVVVLVVAAFLPSKLAEPALRWCGLGFQLLGIYTVVRGLQNRGTLFKRDSVQGWVRRRPRWRPKPQVIEVAGTAYATVGASAKFSLWRGVGDGSVEARLAALEANIETVKKEQQEGTKEVQEATRKTNEAISAERRAREAAVTALDARLEKMGAGGLHVEWMGVIWLGIGTVLATVPGEIATGLQWLAR